MRVLAIIQARFNSSRLPSKVVMKLGHKTVIEHIISASRNSDMIDETIDDLPTLKSDTDTYKKVVDFIHRKGSVSKADILNFLNWGVRISFSGYRNRLRNEKTIKINSI